MSKPAARITDPHTCPMVTPGMPPVPHVGGPVLPPGAPRTLIAGLPAARVGDMCFCVGPPDVIAMGSFTVLIEGKPAARMGDMTSHGGVITAGCMTVLVGDSGGAGSPQGRAMSNAKKAGAPFVCRDCDQAAALAMAAHPVALQSAREPDDAHPEWIEIELVDEHGSPVTYERFRVVGPDGDVREGWTDSRGIARVPALAAGQCRITLPDIDADAWAQA